MLHNSGLYGQNDVPVNMGTPINMSQIGGEMAFTHPNYNTDKTPQQMSQSHNSYYEVPSYPPIGHHPFGFGSPMSPFQNYQPTGFHNNFLQHSANTHIDNAYSGVPNMLPMNPPNHNHHVYHPNIEYKRPAINTQYDYKADDSYKNIPIDNSQVQPNTFHQHINPENNTNYNYNHKINTQQYDDQNLDLSIKSQGKTELEKLDSSKRKSIENTVRLIENILINSTSSKNNNNNCSESPKILNEAEENNEEESFVEEDQGPDSHFEEDDEDHYEKQEETIEKSKIYNKNEGKTIEDKQSQENLQEELPENTAAINLTNTIYPQIQMEIKLSEIKEEPNTDEIPDMSVIVKIEEMTDMTDLDFSNPFQRDVNGVTRESVDCDIIHIDDGINEAKEIIKNDTSPASYFECPYCNLIFKNPKRFLIHTKWHSFGLINDKRLERAKEKLLKKNEKAKVLEGQDIEEVTDGVHFTCKDCNKVFQTKRILKNHRLKFHPTPGRECRVCRMVIVGWTAMKVHLKTHINDTLYQCPDCPKRFKHSTSLAKHRDTHLEKIHPCSECDKMFGSTKQLKIHSKVHERQAKGTTFRCSYCGKGFYGAYNLRAHERTHKNEKPFLCEICNTSYCTNSSLQRHIRVSHSKSKPFVCKVCQRSFTTEVIRDRHELRQHGDPDNFKFKCKHCTCHYLTQKDLRKHTYKAHPKQKNKKRSRKDTDSDYSE